MRKLNAQLSELRGKAAEEQQASLYRLEEAVGRAEAQAADLSQQNEQLRKQLVEASERLPGMLRWVTCPPHLSHSPHAAALLQSRSTPATLLGHPCRFWLHARGTAAGLLWAAVRSKRANMICATAATAVLHDPLSVLLLSSKQQCRREGEVAFVTCVPQAAMQV